MYNKKTFINEVKQYGYVELKDNYIYVCLPVTVENFNLSEEFIEQLKSESKYGYYVGTIVTNTNKPYSQNYLPIYGRSDKFETKWLCKNFKDAIEKDFKDRNLKLLKRANGEV